MASKRKKFTKDQIAHKLGIQAYMVAAWEKQFDITPVDKDGEAAYSRKQLAKFRSIKELLYEKGFSMDAAKKFIQDQPDLEGTTLLAASPLLFEAQESQTPPQEAPQAISVPPQENLELKLKEQQAVLKEREEQLTSQLLSIKEQLLKLSSSL